MDEYDETSYKLRVMNYILLTKIERYFLILR